MKHPIFDDTGNAIEWWTCVSNTVDHLLTPIDKRVGNFLIGCIQVNRKASFDTFKIIHGVRVHVRSVRLCLLAACSIGHMGSYFLSYQTLMRDKARYAVYNVFTLIAL